MSRQELEQSSDQGRGAPAPTAASVAAPRRRRCADPVLLERLAETGFLATEFGLHEQAARIFSCMRRLKPGKPSPRIALAMVLARSGNMQRAIADLHDIIEQSPESELARAVLGTMLVHIGDQEGLRLLEDVVARGVDKAAIDVASSGIDQARAQATARAASTTEAHADAMEFFRHYNVRA